MIVLPPTYMQPVSAYNRVVDQWSPKITGNWATDTALGKIYADEAVAHILGQNNPTTLGHTIKAMIGKGSWSGVEVGFFHRFSEYLLFYLPSNCGLVEPGTERSKVLLPTAPAGNGKA